MGNIVELMVWVILSFAIICVFRLYERGNGRENKRCVYIYIYIYIYIKSKTQISKLQ